MVVVQVHLFLVQYNTTLSKKVKMYFEVMINLIIAVTSCARRN